VKRLEEKFEKKFSESVKDQGEIPENVGKRAAVAGLAASGTAAAGGAALVAHIGIASTGTAIATLHGVAATSATLAWLGGGSVAAGGMGVAGGALVLGTGGLALFAVGGIGAYLYMTRKRAA